MMFLQTPISQLKGVGGQLSQKLAKLDISILRDILYHFPLRYLDYTKITPIAKLEDDQYGVVLGNITNVQLLTSPKKRLSIRMVDATGRLIIQFFYFQSHQKSQFAVGKQLCCFGQVKKTYHGLVMFHPDYQIITEDKPLALQQHLMPVYPTTNGVSQKLLRSLVKQVLDLLKPLAATMEWMPADLEYKHQYPDFYTAFANVHWPKPGVTLNKDKFIFEELLANYLRVREKREIFAQNLAHPIEQPGIFYQKLLANLPFALTTAQDKALHEILHDLSKQQPMLRLVQGDVGCGKTIVAVLSALAVIGAGFQVVLMAPTEILAEQHYSLINNFCKQLGISCGWLAGKLKSKEKHSILEGIQQGTISFIVGTHALFQDAVSFCKLALVIIDEQHRFGVEQRLALWQKGRQDKYFPHQLFLTATPIPRTLAMTFYADLDFSIIDVLPPNRIPVQTVCMHVDKRPALLDKIAKMCALKQKVYWVCPFIEEVEGLAKKIKTYLPTLSIEVVHGKLSSENKESIMHNFKQGAIDILIATTVIEVGVDVPDATIMVIENPEYFGLSQLHQLRGRVGRGKLASYCILLYDSKLSAKAIERLSVMRTTNDGFVLAEKDLEIRGPGELLGLKQAGAGVFKIADFNRDKHLLPLVKECAEQLLARYRSAVKKLCQLHPAVETTEREYNSELI